MVVGIVGGAVLLVGMIGVFLYEAQNAPTPNLTFPVRWSVDDGSQVQRNGELEEDEEQDFSFDLPRPNATRVQIQLTWEDDVGQPDRFNLTITNPATQQTETFSSDNGTISVTYPLNPVPEVANVTAAEASQARQMIADEHTGQLGQATWPATVTLVSAPGQRPVPQAGSIETQPDGENSFRISFSFEIYRGTVQEPRID